MNVNSIRHKIGVFIERPLVTALIVILIVLNAVVLGLETYPVVMAAVGPQLRFLDQLLLFIFVVELFARLFAKGFRFFRDPWNVFDAIIIAVALLPSSGAFSVLRALRVLRVLRLISMFPNLRRVIEGIIAAIPGIGSIGILLLILYYVSAVMATKLFGGTHPQWFGSLDASLFSLFQIMTLEGWADMARDLGQTHPVAIPFLVMFILVATFTVLNLFIGVMLEAMQRLHSAEPIAMGSEASDTSALNQLALEVSALKTQILLMSQAIEKTKNDKNKGLT